MGLAANGNFLVVPTLANYAFTPLVRSYTDVTSDQANQDFTFGKLWTGGGSDALASNPNNWSGLTVPVSSDVVRFDVTNSTKGCVWDLTTQMSSFEMKVGFSSSVVAVSDMIVGTVTIEAGEFLMGSHEVQVFRNWNHSGGRFRATTGGTVRWMGSTLQTVTMVKTSLGSGLFDSYFEHFRVQSSSTVRAVSDLVLDGTFNISTGRFEAMRSTHTLTGGTQTGAGGTFNWDDSFGTFVAGSGQIDFASEIGGIYQIRQGGSTSFNNVSGSGATGVTAVTNLSIAGNLSLGGTASTVHMNGGNGFALSVAGTTSIGPASTSGSPTFSIGTSSVTFLGPVVVGTAVFAVQGGQVNVQGGTFTLTAQGQFQVPALATSRMVLSSNSLFRSNAGTLLIQGSAVFTSSAPGVTRYAVDMNGTVNIQNSAVFSSMDANGFRMRSNSNPVNLKGLDFRDGIAGGAGLNFDPVTLTNVTVDSPIFDVSISTNIRAILDTLVVPTSDIDVIDSTGAHTGPSFENDPSGIVNWGTIGTPSNFSGLSLGVSSITWSWTKVNHPTGFIVESSTGGALSSQLNQAATSWIEVGLSTNSVYTRLVRAVTDVGQADSATASRYTDATSASNLGFTDVAVTSLTVTWALNTNPVGTTFVLERSTNDAVYVSLATNTLAALVPYADTGLTPDKLYYYRVKAVNGDGKIVSTIVKVSTQTLPIPPPSVFTIAPSTVNNLGVKSFSLTGANIQAGAVARLKRSSTIVIPALTSNVVSQSAMTASFDLTGAWALPWDVEIENTDGRYSITSGFNLLTVQDATSTGAVTIRNYTASVSLNFATGGGETSVFFPANAIPSDARIYVSVDPVGTPLKVDPATIASAAGTLAGLTLVPNTIREFAAYTSQGTYTASFGGAPSIAINYPDTNSDGIIDSLSFRAANLHLATLNETSQTWQLVQGARIDTANKRVTSTVNHFSVYALFASPASASLAEAKVYPSPWKIGSSTRFDAASLMITNLTESGTIRIYTLGMHLVKELTYGISDAGSLSWDGRSSEGEQVKSGVYLINIESSSGESKTIKLGIER